MKRPPDHGDTPRRLGTVMLLAAWISILALATLLFGRWLDRDQNPNQLIAGRIGEDDSRIVVLNRNRGGHYVADGLINGVRVTFLVDTGATVVAVPEGLGRKLGLRRGGAVPVRTANGTVTAYVTRLDRVQLGTISLDDVRAVISPGMEGVQVLLGMSFLRQVEFSQSGGALYLRQASPGT